MGPEQRARMRSACLEYRGCTTVPTISPVPSFAPSIVPTVTPSVSEVPSAFPTTSLPPSLSAVPTEALCPDSGDGEVVITIVFDQYQSETTWALVDECDSTAVLEGGPYLSTDTDVEVRECVTDSFYVWTIYDSYSDGICCGYGEGSYEIKWNGQVVGSGSDFGSSESVTFGSPCLSSPSGVPNEEPTSPTGAPNEEPTSPTECSTVSCAIFNLVDAIIGLICEVIDCAALQPFIDLYEALVQLICVFLSC